MPDFLDILAKDTKKAIENGHYECDSKIESEFSLKKNIIACEKNPIISEIKFSSPSGFISKKELNAIDVASSMIRGGAIGISIVTEPKHFNGSLENFKILRKNFSIPILMKDFIMNKVQIETAFKLGANAILLIQALFDRNYCDQSIDEMIDYAHSFKLETLLETHTEEEFKKAINTDADLIGINNRDLRNFTVELDRTYRILKGYYDNNHIIVAESGIKSPNDIVYLRVAGARAFLIGTSIMSSTNVEKKVRELVEA
ncbi:MAG: indole-3-glycerol-phosphate synthase [Candidatus Bathyarchaeota archaeon]|nr:indole-3-glycerol-phosphate synthase [Candidatus Bathyarchaeota archaeon]